MRLKQLFILSITFCCFAGFYMNPLAAKQKRTTRPNIIFIFCDNLGYGDIEPFGSTLHRTPHLNRMAKEGRKFTHCYSASGVCTPSRAALMTGCYPKRISMTMTDGWVLRPVSQFGLHPQEFTVAEMMKKAGYATSIFGKWHLGDQPEFLPNAQGFDHFMGIPYSDDMTPREGTNWPDLPLMVNDQVIEAPCDRDMLAQKLTEAACEWIVDNKDEPFFLYFPQCMPGSTRTPFASEPFRGKSKNGPWGDSIEEIDWSLGEMVRTLEENGLRENTLIVWTSDNGAPRRNPVQGTNKPLAGWGYTTSEGGMRVPCIMSWPGQIAAGSVCPELCTMMDFLPTFAAMTNTPLPTERIIDGQNIEPLLFDKKASTPYEAFYYYQKFQLQAVRSGPWKLNLDITLAAQGKNGKPRKRPASLFHLVDDPFETKNVVADHPEIVARLEKLAEKARRTLGDANREGTEIRPHGIHKNPKPILKQ
ncbi:MAG: sulfatase [Planctomycetaceae bacterium]|nr:sulfatase [Planctomycetaceae bacterium]